MKDFTMQHSALHTSRRALCAGLLIAPIGAVAAERATPSPELRTSGFEAALAEYRAARSRFDTVLTDIQADEAAEYVDRAFLCLLAAPSRKPADIATKLEAMLVEYEDSLWDEDRVRLIAADARHLGKGGF